MGPKKLKEANPILCKEADEFVDLAGTGENIEPLPNLMRISLNFILLTVFNVRADSIEDPLYKDAIEIITTSNKFTNIKYAASQFIPILEVLNPIIGLKKKSHDFHKRKSMPFYLGLIDKALNSDLDNMTKDLNEELNNGKKGYYNNLVSTIRKCIPISVKAFI